MGNLKMNESEWSPIRRIFKMTEGQAGFSSFNPICLARDLREELGEIINAKKLVDG